MAGSFTILSHTADTGIAVVADTLHELFEAAALGMFSLMYDVEHLEPTTSLDLAVEADGVDELLVDVLAELLYWSEADDVIPCSFDVREVTANRATLRARVAPMRPDALIGPPIKAVTYHGLTVEEALNGKSWRATVVFDV